MLSVDWLDAQQIFATIGKLVVVHRIDVHLLTGVGDAARLWGRFELGPADQRENR
jgi:hypothetical protein